ncbi:MAG TPA: NAD(P)/FAD-dependent oxidoreductase [Candidatus Acidoferrales bacterium]|nr:NAD(P)/FAD-dependent oxidoreductase [Candidatus Acidoferrales bacterium]
MPAQALGKKIAVVGASAAGLYAAGLLARAGASVEVFEQAERVEPLRRTLIVTSRMRDILGQVGEPSVVNQIHRFELFTDGRVAKIHLTRPDLVIERSALLRSLGDEARAAGARQQFGRRFNSLEKTQKGLQLNLQTADGRCESREVSTLIGADGAASKVARAGGWPRLTTVPLIQAIVRLPAEYPPDTVRVWFIPDDTRYFYWLIPEADGRGALGLIGEDGAAARRALERFVEKKQFEPQSYQAARIPVYTRWVETCRAFGGGNIHLLGDAAAQVKVTTVGGIVTGLRGAAGVAESIIHGRTRILSKLRRELDTHLLIRRALHHFQQADYSRLVDLLNPGARDSLGIHTRDEAVRVLWNICRRQPRFVLLGLRGLITGRSLALARPSQTLDSTGR